MGLNKNVSCNIGRTFIKKTSIPSIWPNQMAREMGMEDVITKLVLPLLQEPRYDVLFARLRLSNLTTHQAQELINIVTTANIGLLSLKILWDFYCQQTFEFWKINRMR